ncbi:MAG: molybdate transport system ATP-binding protein [Actinomycetota bacterium]|nr:molybdate transport system ATP-binding protein [Actinomycetota bacterium]MDQ1564192.1 molybdate transport system ATP-binding protein [Actinomycetota bacterium]MDQ1574499.1 molybdate transport system ATP-binding protein [Actinomycetota bacterium]
MSALSTRASGLDAVIVVERPAFRLDLALAVPPGTVTAVVGPNGSGKSTTLRALAGLLRMTSGHIRLGDRVLDEGDLHVTAASRGAGVVFQDYLLFPHLSALENVAFGLHAHGMPHKAALGQAREWLDRFALADFAGIRPGQLSGGQAQRVALARAMVLEPELLLLDEPMAALDASTRVEVRAELAAKLRSYGGSTVLVTHDPTDALALADEVVVLDHGSVVQRGPVRAVARAPVNDYVAGLFGTAGDVIA